MSQISKELGITTQAIYRKINKTLKTELQPHIEIVNGQTLISENGVEIIKNSLQQVVNGLQPVDNQAELEFYRDQIIKLQDDLKIEREHSRNMADELVRLNENNQTILREYNLLKLQPPAADKVKFWQRIFKKNDTPQS